MSSLWCFTWPILDIYCPNEVAKFMFLHLSVILFTEGVWLSACLDTTPPRTRHSSGSRHPPDQAPPGTRPADGCCCGRYTSYWNAFLLEYITAGSFAGLLSADFSKIYGILGNPWKSVKNWLQKWSKIEGTRNFDVMMTIWQLHQVTQNQSFWIEIIPLTFLFTLFTFFVIRYKQFNWDEDRRHLIFTHLSILEWIY